RHVSVHGDADHEVAVAADLLVQALAFGADHERAVHVVLELVVGLRGALVQSDDPDIARFQLLKRAADVGDACDGHVLGGACRRPGHSSGHAHGAALWNHDSVHAGSVGGA